ncbi:MAG: hypothetical protein H6638_13215 [Ardenticatenales bacterium]|nr:hypothetical protein [Ardenticatenales bacterium]
MTDAVTTGCDGGSPLPVAIRARPRAAVPDRGPPCPTAGRRARPRARARPWATVPDRGPPWPTAGRRARSIHRVTIAVHARQRTTTAGRPYTVAMVCGCPTAGRRARPRVAVPDRGPPCSSVQ